MQFTETIFTRAGIFHVSYKDRLRKLDTLSLKMWRRLYDYEFVSKISAGLDDLDFQTLFKKSPTIGRTRDHSFRILREKAQTDEFRNSFTQRMISQWDDLPQYVVSSNFERSFIEKVRKIMMAKGW